jgi:hypothetical protein
MSDNEGDITRFRTCRKINLKDLRDFSIWFLVTVIFLSGVILLAFGSGVFAYAWIIALFAFFGLFNLGWYIKILFDCDHLASATLSDCISECRDKYCSSDYCFKDDYSWCTNRCREIFGYDP